nr:hypothetical protein [Spirochaetota bacterium]
MKKKISLKFISTFFIAAFSITALISSCAFADEFLTVTKKFVQKDEKAPLAVPKVSCLKTKVVQGEIIDLEATSDDEGVIFNWSVEG